MAVAGPNRISWIYCRPCSHRGADSLVAKMAEAIWTAEDSAVNLTIAALIAAKLTAPGMDDVVVFRNVVRNLQCAYEAVAAAGKAVEDNPLARKSQAQR